MHNQPVYLAIDVGGSKTLLAVFSHEGQVLAQHKIATNPDYKKFLEDIRSVINNEFSKYEFVRCCCAIPGTVDRQHGVGVRFGNLKWQNVPLSHDLSQLLDNIPVLLEHDETLGGLSEALILQGEYRKVLYVTIGTGIGSSYIVDGKVNPDLADSEAGHMVLEYKGKLERWENLASGRALKEHYGKTASEINDPKTWREYAYRVALGLDELIAILQPEVVVIGGGVGSHLEKFINLLNNELEKFENEMVKIPLIIKARRPEEAVIYGCYELIRQHN